MIERERTRLNRERKRRRGWWRGKSHVEVLAVILIPYNSLARTQACSKHGYHDYNAIKGVCTQTQMLMSRVSDNHKRLINVHSTVELGLFVCTLFCNN